MPDRRKLRVLGMPDVPREHVQLSYEQHQERLRRWVLYLWEPLRRAGRHKTQLASALGISKQTVGAYIKGTEKPGLECFVKLHFRQGLDPLRLLREEPPPLAVVTAAPTQEQVPAQRKRVARK